MLASGPPVKKMKTECGTITTLRADAELTFTSPKRKNIRRRKLRTEKRILDVTITKLIDLNDDCLYKIFELTRVSLFDFYSLSQTCARFNDIGSGIFQRKIKVCDLRNITDAEIVIGVLKTFRSVISELRICMSSISYSNSLSIMESITRYCTELKSLTIEGCNIPANNQNEITKFGLLFKNLEELHLAYVFIEKFDDINEEIRTAKGTLTSNVFTNCQSLISLKVVNCYHLKRAIFESNFPKLEHFDYKSGDFDVFNNINDFILRHHNLKSFRLDTDDNDYLEVLAAGCKNLTNLNIRLDTKLYLHSFLHRHRRPHSTLNDSVKCLAKFQHLKQLTVACGGYDAATKLIEVLPQLSPSLECFHVETFSGSLALMPTVIKLKNLRVFRLHEHNGTIDISRIGELTGLIELSLMDVEVKKVDLIKMVNDLVSLKKLQFYVNDFKITNYLYVQLLDVLKRRKPEDQHLDMYCPTAIDFVQESQTMVKIKF